MRIKNKNKFITLLIFILVVIFIIIFKFINKDVVIMNYSNYEELTVTSDAFNNGGTIPIQYTGKGEDISPSLNLSTISENAVSIAIIMDDLDVPIIGTYNHWVIWNIPVQNVIPENIPYGTVVESLGNAVQGNGYGKHRYRGPKPPFGTHRYQFHVFILDCELDLSSNTRKKELLESMNGHIVQYGYIIGVFK